jgi:hypothetical protein
MAVHAVMDACRAAMVAESAPARPDRDLDTVLWLAFFDVTRLPAFGRAAGGRRTPRRPRRREVFQKEALVSSGLFPLIQGRQAADHLG